VSIKLCNALFFACQCFSVAQGVERTAERDGFVFANALDLFKVGWGCRQDSLSAA